MRGSPVKVGGAESDTVVCAIATPLQLKTYVVAEDNGEVVCDPDVPVQLSEPPATSHVRPLVLPETFQETTLVPPETT